MSTITREFVLKDFSKLKSLAQKSIKNGKYKNAVELICKASELMYNANVFYTDSELENMILELSKKTLPEVKYEKTKNTILFYDYFSFDNRGLTEQYLNALIKSDYNVVYVSRRGNCQLSKHIFEKLNNAAVKTFSVIDINKLQVAENLIQIFKQISPEIILVHTAPWDVEGVMTLHSVKQNSLIYNINLTDHAFWLGASVFHYNIEFRDYGYNISKKRGFSEKQILKLPYYPIINTSIEAKELPFNIENKKLFLSGGNIDKIKGDDSFLQIVKYILDSFPDTLFLYLGNESDIYFKNFIEKYNFQERFYTLNERKDIFNVFTKSYMFLNTYPVSGGLMSQLSCMAGRLPLTLNIKNYPDNRIDELLSEKLPFNLVFENIDELKNTIQFYYNNPDVLEKNQEKLKNVIISEESFNHILYKYFTNPVNEYKKYEYEIDNSGIEEMFLSILNEKNKYNQIMKSRNLFVVFHFAKYTLFYYLHRFVKKY